MFAHNTRRWGVESLKRAAQAPCAFWIIWFVIMAYASVLRLYALDRYPILFNQDEMVMGYDAWSLWTTGRDHHGSLLPIHFTTFGDYVPPTTNYLTAPFVGLLGLSEFSTRLPIALMGIATIGLVALLGRRWFGPGAGLLAALFLTISSWHINYSRIGFPASVIPFWIVCSLYAFTRAATHLKTSEHDVGQKRWRTITWFIISAVCFALLTGAYPVMKIEAPLLVAACLLAAARTFWRHRRMAVIWLGTYLICVSPLLIDQVVRWDLVSARFRQVNMLGNPEWPLEALRLYSEHYNPSALAFTTFRGGVGIYSPFIGDVFWLDLPLSLIAAFALAHHRRARLLAFSLPVLLAVWFITYPIADSLTLGDSNNSSVGHPHEIRAYNLLPLPELLAGYGAVVVWQQLRKYRWGWLPAGGYAAGVAGLIVFFNFRFLPSYFDSRVDSALTPYNYGLRSALDVVAHNAQPCDSIWVDDDNQAYIYFLFLTRYSPARSQSWATAVHGDFSDFDQYHAGKPDRIAAPAPSVKPECEGQPYRAFFVTRSNFTAAGWELLPLGNDAPSGTRWQVNVTTAQIPWPKPPSEAVSLKATLGDLINLEGYQLQRDGRILTLSLYWRTYSQLPDYGVFIHVMGKNGLVAQQDGIPTPPPHAWVPGQLVITSHHVELPDSASEFDSIALGMYRYPSLDRLSTIQNGAPGKDGLVLISTINSIP